MCRGGIRCVCVCVRVFAAAPTVVVCILSAIQCVLQSEASRLMKLMPKSEGGSRIDDMFMEVDDPVLRGEAKLVPTQSTRFS